MRDRWRRFVCSLVGHTGRYELANGGLVILALDARCERCQRDFTLDRTEP